MKYSILHVIAYFAPAWGFGGPVKIAFDLAKKAVDHGYKTTVYTTNISDDNKIDLPAGREEIDGISVFRFPNINNWMAKNNIWTPRGLSEVLKKEIKTFDFIYLHEYRTSLNIKVALEAQKNKIPYFLFAYGTMPYGSGWKKWAKIFFDIFWGKKILRNAKLVFAQTINEKKEYLKLGVSRNKIKPFPLMVDLSEFKNLPQKKTARKKFNFSSSDFIISFLGRLNRYKGIDLIIKAVDRLKTKIPEIKLLIVGRDEGYLSVLKALIKKNKLEKHVFLHPPLYGNSRLMVYCASDIFSITPNFYEETSLASIESLACGIPVIVTKQAEISYLKDYDCGAIINYNLSDLVNKITYYYNNRQNMSEIRIRAKKLIKDKYNLEVLYNQFESCQN